MLVRVEIEHKDAQVRGKLATQRRTGDHWPLASESFQFHRLTHTHTRPIKTMSAPNWLTTTSASLRSWSEDLRRRREGGCRASLRCKKRKPAKETEPTYNRKSALRDKLSSCLAGHVIQLANRNENMIQGAYSPNLPENARRAPKRRTVCARALSICNSNTCAHTHSTHTVLVIGTHTWANQ